MKKIIILSVLLFSVLSFTSCKKKVKKEVKPTKNLYSVDSKTTAINWIAYKTTSKVPVKGEFSKLIIENTIKASTAMEALDGLKFSIPVNSLITNDTIRDGKLKKFFFGTMLNTTAIEGTIDLENDTSGSVRISMNGIAHDLPITYKVNGQSVNMEAVLNLDNWKAQLALEALNEVCEELHTGSDGITKTWSDVKIDVTTYLKYE